MSAAAYPSRTVTPSHERSTGTIVPCPRCPRTWKLVLPHGYATIAGTDLNLRAWTKVDWLVIANMIYQGPSKAVSGPQLAAHASFAQLPAR